MEQFIEAVRHYPCLWDISTKEYRNSEKKETAWKCIVEKLNLAEIKNVKEAKTAWKKIRDNHRDSLKRMKTTSGQAARYNNTWRYAEVMEFLLPHMKNRNTSTNIIAQSSEDSETHEVQDDENENNSEISVSSRNDTINNIETGVSQADKTEARKRRTESDFIDFLKEMEQHHQKRQEDRDLRRMTNALKDKDAIDLFLESMAITIKTMPTWMQSRIKKKIFLIVSDAEEELENCSISVITPDSVNNAMPVAAGSSCSANYGYSTSGETVNNIMPVVAESARSTQYDLPQIHYAEDI